MKKSVMILSLLLALICVAVPAFALEVTADEKSPVQVTGTNEKEDYVLMGQIVEFSGTGGDIRMFGNNINMMGTGMESGIFIGQSVKIDGDIRNDIYTGGQTVEITGTAGDNVFFFGQDLMIGKDTVINGSLIAMGNEVRIYGDIMGDLIIGAGYVTIDGTVYGNVNAEVGSLTITERGAVKGDVTYASEHPLRDKDNARISGTVTLRDSLFEDKHTKMQESKGGFMAAMKIFWFFGMLTGGLLLLLFPGFKTLFKEQRESRRFWQSLLWGLIPVLIYPVATALLMIVFPLAVALALAAAPLAGLTVILGTTLLGQFLFKAFKWKNDKRHLFFLFGAIPLFIVLMIPVISSLVIFALSALGWGVLLELLFNKKFGEIS